MGDGEKDSQRYLLKMCGIFVFVPKQHGDQLETTRSIDNHNNWLHQRGPDHVETVYSGTRRVQLSASVLQMRQEFVPQPVAVNTEEEIFLAWNGEIYHEELWNDAVSDTMHVVEKLRLALKEEDTISTEAVAKALNKILSTLSNAEFACCLITPHCVLYARDPWGRRSLVVSNELWCLASVATDDETLWEEVKPGVVHAYDVDTQQSSEIPFETAVASVPSPLFSFSTMEEASHQLEVVLADAVRRRCRIDGTAVLFSGGLDSVVVAALALRVLPSLTLATVSFVDSATTSTAPAADAMAAEASYRELVALYPDKPIHFAHKVVDWAMVVESNETRMRQLIKPKTTIMDLNIASALWFAATAAEETNRVLLSGLGADEFMGGYGRHRRAFDSGGWDQLQAELELDQSRLWDRNMGRDDRVLSDTSHEVRFPFLDPGVVHFLNQQVPLQQVVDFSLEKGGDKRILRVLAARLGLQAASLAPKRAIQFGSRVAHVSDKRRFGSRRKSSGTANAF